MKPRFQSLQRLLCVKLQSWGTCCPQLGGVLAETVLCVACGGLWSPGNEKQKVIVLVGECQ